MMATAAREKKRKIKDVVTSVVSQSPAPPPDSFLPLSQVPTAVESPGGECCLHTGSVIRRKTSSRKKQIDHKLTHITHATQQKNNTTHTKQSQISSSASVPSVQTPESTKDIVICIADDPMNAILDPGFCADCCPYSTGDLCVQRFEMLKRIYQITRVLETPTSEFLLLITFIIY